MPEVERGEIWYVALDPVIGSEQVKTRPCLIVQRDAANAASPVTIVCPLTDAHESPGSIVAVKIPKGEGGLKKSSLVLCNQVRAVSLLRLQRCSGALGVEAMRRVDRGLRTILDL